MRPSNRWRLDLLWAAIVLAAILALAAGSGALGSGGGRTASLYQRALQVAGEYRCPVCQGETAAASDAPQAVEMKSLIQGWLREGRSPAQIRSYLVADYGVSILEKPPASGLGALLWVLPGVAVALGVAGLGFGFSRWRRLGSTGPSALTGVPPTSDGAPPAPVAGPSSVPLAGPSSMPLAGPSSMPLAGPSPVLAVQGALFDVGALERRAGAPVRPAEEPIARPGGRRRYQRATLLGGVALVVLAGALWLVDRSASARLPGGTVTGSVTGIGAELAQASALTTSDPAAALAIYDTVLAGDPGQPVALTAEGWIYVDAGFVSKGIGLLAKAEAYDPSYGLAHFYRGMALLDYERHPAAAVSELKWYLGHGPAPALEAAAREALALALVQSTKAGKGKGHT